MRDDLGIVPDTRVEDQSLPLRETAFLSLRRAILTGKLEPGERLTEVRLGRILGTSRTPIREAIRKLELEGLVTITPGSGARVAKITEQELQEVMEVRNALDQLCAQLACKRITEEGRHKLKRALDEFESTTVTGDQLEIAEADVRFHAVITDAAANRKLKEILNGLADNIYRYRYEFIKDDNHYEMLVKEHREIYEGIISGDEERARKAANVHIHRQWEFIRDQLHLSQNRKDENKRK